MLASFTTFDVKKILRGENLGADMLSKINQSASSYAKVQEITTASIDEIQFNLIEN